MGLKMSATGGDSVAYITDVKMAEGSEPAWFRIALFPKDGKSNIATGFMTFMTKEMDPASYALLMTWKAERAALPITITLGDPAAADPGGQK